jgi:hypothetical protein
MTKIKMVACTICRDLLNDETLKVRATIAHTTSVMSQEMTCPLCQGIYSCGATQTPLQSSPSVTTLIRSGVVPELVVAAFRLDGIQTANDLWYRLAKDRRVSMPAHLSDPSAS